MKNNEASTDTSDTKDIEQKLIGIEKKFKVYRKRFLIVIYVMRDTVKEVLATNLSQKK